MLKIILISKKWAIAKLGRGFAIMAVLLPFALASHSITAQDLESASRNKPDRLDWFRDQGFGLFVHWSVDSQLGVVISHSLVGASDDYTNRFFNDLPRTFNPTRFDPNEWARLAATAGVRYVMFTTKHHSGFTMFHSETTPFGIENTPFHRDITAEVFDAFRHQGIAAGVYFSPDDFYWLHQHGKPIKRHVPEVEPSNNPGLLQYDRTQVTELLTHYGPVDLIFFDGEASDLRELAWKLQPNIIVTRGALETPELAVPSGSLPGPWEASITMGTAWQYQPDNERYKSGSDLIRLLFQTRAKGGNLLLNVGPMANGQLAIEQENRLREIGLWMFVNGESIYGVRPWIIPNEGDIWFTQKKNKGPLYAILDSTVPWERGTWREFTLHSVRANKDSSISVLGQDDKTVEYKPTTIPQSTWTQQEDGLHIRVMRAQRLQDNSQWPNAVVVKLTDVTPSLTPPRVKTGTSAQSADGASIVLHGELLDTGDAPALDVGFEYRATTGEDTHARSAVWISTETRKLTAKGIFQVDVRNLAPGSYEFHAFVKHPLLTLYGEDKPVIRSITHSK
ncbi:alpha-L-fucosidase [Granulicella arctica]|uniref:alpha-L-fucosidase n=1 Tax=Granulicella arctica TaxID=940613 RepID=UPI0021E01CB4|nr:alpha-L-fucosidase [Granulicella arctica]